jgi:hypothetical protein
MVGYRDYLRICGASLALAVLLAGCEAAAEDTAKAAGEVAAEAGAKAASGDTAADAAGNSAFELGKGGSENALRIVTEGSALRDYDATTSLGSYRSRVMDTPERDPGTGEEALPDAANRKILLTMEIDFSIASDNEDLNVKLDLNGDTEVPIDGVQNKEVDCSPTEAKLADAKSREANDDDLNLLRGLVTTIDNSFQPIAFEATANGTAVCKWRAHDFTISSSDQPTYIYYRDAIDHRYYIQAIKHDFSASVTSVV